VADDNGLTAGGLAEFHGVLNTTGDGMAVVGPDLRYVYVNAAACRILGRPLDQLIGHDFLDSFDPGDQDRILAQLPKHVGEATAPILCVLPGGNGGQRDVLCATFALDMPAEAATVVIVRDLSPPGVAASTAHALAQSAHVIGTGSTQDTLIGIARLVVEGGRALACGITVVGEQGALSMGGGYGFPQPDQRQIAWRGGVLTLDDLPGAQVLFDHQAIFLPDARTTYEADAVMHPFTAALDGTDWQGAAYVPLIWEAELVGFLGAFLPSRVNEPSAAESAYFAALADQAAVIVINSRLAAAHERNRLARELHDSVSQALFSMTLHARAAQLAMDRDDLDTTTALGRSVAQLVDLTRGALAEMRAMIFELRPAALAEEGLVSALRKQAAALSARESVRITIRGPERRLHLAEGVEEHLYRIATEALHNVAKHARAAAADVTITEHEDHLQLTVSDDGIGFDLNIHRAGHLGVSTMTQRADTVGATLSMTSTPGVGTTVGVTLPRHASPQLKAG
jgi:signal transduction histidine kinase